MDGPPQLNRPRPLARIPVISGLIFIASVWIICVFWNLFLPTSRAPNVAIVVSIGLWFVYRVSVGFGPTVQESIRRQFDRAQDEDAGPYWIGGARWTFIRGEAHRVMQITDETVFHDPEMRDDRLQLAAEGERGRRRHIYGWLIAALFFGVAWDGASDAPGEADGIGLTRAITLVCVLVLGWFVFRETLYRFGYQRMKGAKVIDREPVSFDQATVAEQMAHGSARLATESEARQAALGGVRRSSVHDQEF